MGVVRVACVGGVPLFLSYRGGKFVAYGDSKTSYQSSDALTWTVMSGIEQATYCDGTYKSRSACLESAWFDGVWLRADWQGIISRSTDGKSFARAYLDDQKHTLYQEPRARRRVRRAVVGARARAHSGRRTCTRSRSRGRRTG